MTDQIRHADQPDIPAALISWALLWSDAEGDGCLTLARLARRAGLSRRTLTYWQEGRTRPFNASLSLLWAALVPLCGLRLILPRSTSDRYGLFVQGDFTPYLSAIPGEYLIVWVDDLGVPRRVARGSWPSMMGLDDLTVRLRAELAPRLARRRAGMTRATCARPVAPRCGEWA